MNTQFSVARWVNWQCTEIVCKLTPARVAGGLLGKIQVPRQENSYMAELLVCRELRQQVLVMDADSALPVVPL